jgi:hypothetical protein
MKRWMTILAGMAVLLATQASADAHHMEHMSKSASKAITVTGEIVDLGCYVGHGAKGEKHKECASKCIAGGMPIGLLTPKGKLYILTPNHDDADAYAKSKDLAASMVTITGTLMERGGVSAIDVTEVKEVAAK